MASKAAESPVLRLNNRPESLREWAAGLFRHRGVLMELSRKDFRVRYKRTTLGVVWSAFVPLVQAVIMAFIFSRVGAFGNQDYNYAGFVLAGMAAYAYASLAVTSATTSIVDSSSLTDKVWFPRALLALVPPVSNLVTLAISVLVVIVALPILGAPYTLRLLLLFPAVVLLISFVTALGLVLSALYVYFRDVKFIVQAAMLVWFYVTPIVYPPDALGTAGRWLYLNPLTGIAGLFQRAAVDAPVPSGKAVAVSVGVTIVLFVAGVMLHRRHDRLFVDQL